MKNTKIVALVAAVALLVLGAAFTSFAAAKYNWYQQDGVWRCADKNGDDYTQAVAKSGNDYYYLDENGEMATSLLTEIDDALYYFDPDGKMVKNDWRKVENTDDEDGDEFYWYYLTASGKAKKSTKTPVAINGKKYMFDDDSRMMYGWIGGNNTKDDDYAWQSAVYYAGDAEDGAVKTGWQHIEVVDDDPELDFEEQTYWFYLGTTGKKVYASEEALLEKSINGKKYVFDDMGVMRAEWEQTASQSTAAEVVKDIKSYYWFQDESIGAKLKKKWFRTTPQKAVNATDNADEVAHWYYAVGDGTLYKDVVKTIAGKKYAFNDKGEMLAGLYIMDIDSGELKSKTAIDTEKAVAALTAADAVQADVYFFGDEETDGSMKYGTVKTEIDGDEYTFVFNSTGANKGKAVFGLKGGAYYANGAKVKADADLKYQAFECTFGEDGKVLTLESEALTASEAKAAVAAKKDVCLIGTSGTIVKSGTKKDADGIKFTVSGYAVTAVE